MRKDVPVKIDVPFSTLEQQLIRQNNLALPFKNPVVSQEAKTLDNGLTVVHNSTDLSGLSKDITKDVIKLDEVTIVAPKASGDNFKNKFMKWIKNKTVRIVGWSALAVGLIVGVIAILKRR